MFDKCNKTESFLASRGVTREYREDVSYSELEPNWDTINHGRPESQAKMEDAVLSYAEMMARGSAAPAVILRVTETGLEVLDGCQRLMANAETGGRHCAAYVIQCSDGSAARIRKASNSRLNTQAKVDQKWLLQEAVISFCIKENDSPEEVADLMGMTNSAVRRQVEIEKARIKTKVIGGQVLGKLFVLNDGQLEWYSKNIKPDDEEGRAVKFLYRAMDECKEAGLKNSSWSNKMSEALPKRLGNKNRGTQWSSTYNAAIKGDAHLQAALIGDLKKRGELNSLLDGMKGIVTKAAKYKKTSKNCRLSDDALVQQLDDNFQELSRILRQCVNSELLSKFDPFMTDRK